MSAVTYLAPQVGILAACVMLAVARASYYRSLVAGRGASDGNTHHDYADLPPCSS